MKKTVSLDKQYFDVLRNGNFFYVDKTSFIREWWDAGDTVTLITRPRRFGKTLMLTTVESFFSCRFTGTGALFDGLDIWREGRFRDLQGTIPVIFLSLAAIKYPAWQVAKTQIKGAIKDVFDAWKPALYHQLSPRDRKSFDAVCEEMSDAKAIRSLHLLCKLLTETYGKKPLILLDEYDAPLIEAWRFGFWDKMSGFLRTLFNATFKTNPNMDRALLTGVARVSQESLFSDFNNLRVAGVTTDKYTTSFGFTEAEVFAAMDSYGFQDKAGVKEMYDGFTFGSTIEIYNPWSVINYLQTGNLDLWWANTSANSLVDRLVKTGSPELKKAFETLLQRKSIQAELDEHIVFQQIAPSTETVLSLLLTAGYLRPVTKNGSTYELAITNGEVVQMFDNLIKAWFPQPDGCDDFIHSLLRMDVAAMNAYMNEVAFESFSFFDTAKKSRRARPERFYHGFVLGLLVRLRGRYIITSNRESGFGRYDIMLEPMNPQVDDAFIIEFKVRDVTTEKSLAKALAAAKKQISEKKYAQALISRGIPAERIHSLGMVFSGKKVLVG